METLFNIIGIVMGLLLLGVFVLPVAAYFIARATVIGIVAGKRVTKKPRNINGNESSKEEKRSS